MKNRKNFSGFAPIIILVLIALAVVGYFGYKNYWPKTQTLVVNSPIPTATADPTANWKTYTDTKYGISFRYPSSFISDDRELTAPKGVTYIKSFEKDIKICKGCGYAGADEVEKGLMTGVSVFSTTESLLSLAQRQFATKLDMNKVSNMTIDGKEATELVFPMGSPGTRGEKVLIKLPQNIVVAYFDVGYNTTDVEFNQYSQEFDQILSTFKFTQ